MAAPTTSPGTTLVSFFSQNLRCELRLNLALGGISVFHKTKYASYSFWVPPASEIHYRD